MGKTNTDDIGDIACGYMLIGVFYVHALYGVSESLGADAALVGIQLKLLAPVISAFFLLSGMSSRALDQKQWRPMLRYSVTLLLLAAASHLVAALLDLMVTGRTLPVQVLAEIGKPILLGTGHANFIGWFFVVLAFARIFAWLFLRSKRGFLLAAAGSAAVISVGGALGLPDNIYEWRNWPTATLFLLCGIYLPRKVRIPPAAGLACLPLSLAVGWLNRPGMMDALLCWTCDPGFVSQPMVGQYGFLPAYLLQQVLFITFLLWSAAWSCRMVAGRVGRYFGQRSLPMLILHGWVVVFLYPLAADGLPDRESGFLFLAILSCAIVAHAVLFEIAKPVLIRFIALMSAASGAILRPSVRVPPAEAPLPATSG